MAMVEAIVQIVAIALVGSLCVPALMLVLAKFGIFPPIAIDAFGSQWRFAPRVTYVMVPANAVISANTAIANNSVKTTTETSVFAVVFLPRSVHAQPSPIQT
jgi:hypothetical protein